MSAPWATEVAVMVSCPDSHKTYALPITAKLLSTTSKFCCVGRYPPPREMARSRGVSLNLGETHTPGGQEDGESEVMGHPRVSVM